MPHRLGLSMPSVTAGIFFVVTENHPGSVQEVISQRGRLSAPTRPSSEVDVPIGPVRKTDPLQAVRVGTVLHIQTDIYIRVP